MIMLKPIYVLCAAAAIAAMGCGGSSAVNNEHAADGLIVSVDNKSLTVEMLKRDMPKGLEGMDSVTFAKMYIENWVVKQLKMSRASELLPSYQEPIERLVEDYRQSLIMRQLDQYYIDQTIDHDVTEKQILSYYRAHSASFKLDHHKVRGVIVKAPANFRNTKTLTTALNNVRKSGDVAEVSALAEKMSLQLTDMSASWVAYTDFLSNLPTVRTNSYESFLAKNTVQQMSSDEAHFYFVIIDVARKGSVAPIECVEDDIHRLLYSERRAEIVRKYEGELMRGAFGDSRIVVADSSLLQFMPLQQGALSADSVSVDIEEVVEE